LTKENSKADYENSDDTKGAVETSM
jgi:hypothetical protein